MKMTPEQIKEAEAKGHVPHIYFVRGWHFCEEWDGLLIGPGTSEMDACLCAVKHTHLANASYLLDDIVE